MIVLKVKKAVLRPLSRCYIFSKTTGGGETGVSQPF